MVTALLYLLTVREHCPPAVCCSPSRHNEYLWLHPINKILVHNTFLFLVLPLKTISKFYLCPGFFT